jgi:hypothetical protein
MISTPRSFPAACAPASTDFQKMCVVPFGMTAILSDARPAKPFGRACLAEDADPGQAISAATIVKKNVLLIRCSFSE